MPGASRPRCTNESIAFGFYKRTVVLMLEIEEVATVEGEEVDDVTKKDAIMIWTIEKQ